MPPPLLLPQVWLTRLTSSTPRARRSTSTTCSLLPSSAIPAMAPNSGGLPGPPMISLLSYAPPPSPDTTCVALIPSHSPLLTLLQKSTKEEKKALIYEAHEHAKRALELSPGDFAAHKWAGITLSSVGDFEGSKVQISNAFIIREHFDHAIQINPRDPTSKHLLGLWCFTFADMPWYTAKIAAALFATPPSSSYDESLKLFLDGELPPPPPLPISIPISPDIDCSETRSREPRAGILPQEQTHDRQDPDQDEAQRRGQTLA